MLERLHERGFTDTPTQPISTSFSTPTQGARPRAGHPAADQQASPQLPARRARAPRLPRTPPDPRRPALKRVALTRRGTSAVRVIREAVGEVETAWEQQLGPSASPATRPPGRARPVGLVALLSATPRDLGSAHGGRRSRGGDTPPRRGASSRRGGRSCRRGLGDVQTRTDGAGQGRRQAPRHRRGEPGAHRVGLPHGNVRLRPRARPRRGRQHLGRALGRTADARTARARRRLPDGVRLPCPGPVVVDPRSPLEEPSEAQADGKPTRTSRPTPLSRRPSGGSSSSAPVSRA